MLARTAPRRMCRVLAGGAVTALQVVAICAAVAYGGVSIAVSLGLIVAAVVN